MGFVPMVESWVLIGMVEVKVGLILLFAILLIEAIIKFWMRQIKHIW